MRRLQREHEIHEMSEQERRCLNCDVVLYPEERLWCFVCNANAEIQDSQVQQPLDPEDFKQLRTWFMKRASA